MLHSRLYLLAALTTLLPALAEAEQPPPKRSLEFSTRFVDITGFRQVIDEKPTLVTAPTPQSLAQYKLADFGLSFNCEVAEYGPPRDCRPLYAVPKQVDAFELTRKLGPLFRPSRESVLTARRKGYRVTIDVALVTQSASGNSAQCLPPMCMVEGGIGPPPPAPMPPESPAVKAAVANAEKCFNEAWVRSRVLRMDAEGAVLGQTSITLPAGAAKKAALDYVHNRQEQMACIADLLGATRALPLTSRDRQGVQFSLSHMRGEYFGQTKYELAILAGLLDLSAGLAEERVEYPNP